MKLKILLFAFLAGCLPPAFSPALVAQALPKEPSARQRAEIDKELRKSFLVSNESGSGWSVGIEKKDKMVGSMEVLVFNEKKNKFEVKKKFKEGDEINLKDKEIVLLSPAPPTLIPGIKTGKNFLARIYLKDTNGKKIYLTVERESGGKTENKTCYYSFPQNTDMNVYGKIFHPTEGKGDFAGYFISDIGIVGATLP